MKYFTIGCVLLLLILGCAPRGLQNNQQGMQYLQKGNIAEAEREFITATNEDPSNSVFHNNLGVAYLEQGRFTEALTEFNKALELDNSNSFAHVGLADIYTSQKKYDSAYEEYMKAIEIAPARESGRSKLANIAYELNKTDKTKEYLESLIKDETPEGLDGINKFFLAQQALIRLMILTGDYQGAHKRAAECVDMLKQTKTETGGYVIPIITPFFFYVRTVPKQYFNLDVLYNSFYYLQGAALLHQGRYKEADDILRKAIEKQDDSIANILIGSNWLAQDNPKEALYYLRKTVDKFPRLGMAKILYAAALKATGENTKGDEIYQEAMKINKTRFDINLKANYENTYGLAYYHHVSGKLDDAIETYKKVIYENPRMGLAYRMLVGVQN